MSRPEHAGPWTEAEFLALGETRERIELIDGELVVSPSPNRPHQGIIFYLMSCLVPAAVAANQTAFLGVDIRLGPGRVLTPDIVAGKLTWELGVADAADVVLACEVTSPSNANFDRRQKMAYYAEAGIEWYLLVEPDMSDYRAVTLRLHRLEDDHYVEHAVARPGQVLASDGPFPIAISTTRLIGL